MSNEITDKVTNQLIAAAFMPEIEAAAGTGDLERLEETYESVKSLKDSLKPKRGEVAELDEVRIFYKKETRLVPQYGAVVENSTPVYLYYAFKDIE